MSIINVVKSFFIGIALVIPGLSGSIFAVVVGLYEDIINAISSFSKDIKVNIKFLLPVALGCVMGILASTKAVLWLCENYQLQSYMFFIGLVLGSVPLIWRKMSKIEFKAVYLILSVLSFAAILLTSGGSSDSEKSYIAIQTLSGLPDFLTLTLAGIISVSLMMIPGISGSVMLMVIGQYGTVYNAVGSSLDFLMYVIKGDFTMAAECFMTVALIIPFLLGALIGIVIIAKILSFLLKKWESLVYYCVLGLIGGAIVVLALEGGVVDITGNISTNILKIVIGIIFIVIGCVCTVFLDNPKEK